jgi:hypothetical protein
VTGSAKSAKATVYGKAYMEGPWREGAEVTVCGNPWMTRSSRKSVWSLRLLAE